MAQITLVYPGKADSPSGWSGIPAGLLSGLRECGAEVTVVSADLPRGTRRVISRVGLTEPARAVVRSAAVRRRLRTARGAGAVLQIGTSYVLPAGYRACSFDDMTVVQSERLGDSWFMTHSESTRSQWRRRQQVAYEHAAKCLVASEFAKQSVVDDYGIDPARVAVVGIGHRRQINRSNDDWSTPRFLTVAADWRRKNVEMVIRAFSQVHARRPEARLDIVGGYSGPRRPGVEIHGMLRLDDPDQTRQLDALFANATCYVMPSRLEAWGIAYLEAGAAGVPSIGTRVGGAPEAIGDGGLTVDPNSLEELVDAMLRLSDEAEARRLGRLAKGHSEQFTWSAVAGRVLAAMRDESRSG